MQKFTLVTLFAMCTFSAVHAQKFINHSVEPSNTSAPCTHIPPSVYYNYMQQSGYAFCDTLLPLRNSAPVVYTLSDQCGEGLPVNGDYFIGIAATAYGKDGISLKLDHTLDVGRLYTVSFYVKGSRLGSSCPLKVGYSDSGTSLGTQIGTVPKPTGTTWSVVSFNFTPTAPWEYITVQGVETSNQNYKDYTFVDEFSITDYYTGVNDINAVTEIKLHPNPFTERASFELSNNMSLPCTMQIMDITGKVISNTIVNDRKVVIERGDMKSGMYMLQLIDANHNKAVSKLMIQ